MKNSCWLFAILFMVFSINQNFAQGPPITGDSPIMIGGGRILLRNITEIRSTDRGTFVWAPLMVHYLPTSNSVVAVHLPLVHYNFDSEFSDLGNGTSFGDLQIMGKYQFYRKDGMGKTLRMVVKTLQNLPTGKELGIEGMSTGHYESYLGTVLGYETLEYGISTEFGYNFSPNGSNDNLKLELGFGLPLLEPTYPVNQLNLYFEYENQFYTENSGYRLLFAQGIQYAVDQLTLDAAVQISLVQDLLPEQKRNYSIFIGGRYVF
ncbi:MAG TPA: hypothetical protein VFM82_00600 [Flavobacteriaceae bacterium]|nr:hypothetical protein [Flavobacteriaceae bacterium]